MGASLFSSVSRIIGRHSNDQPWTPNQTVISRIFIRQLRIQYVIPRRLLGSPNQKRATYQGDNWKGIKHCDLMTNIPRSLEQRLFLLRNQNGRSLDSLRSFTLDSVLTADVIKTPITSPISPHLPFSPPASASASASASACTLHTPKSGMTERTIRHLILLQSLAGSCA